MSSSSADSGSELESKLESGARMEINRTYQTGNKSGGACYCKKPATESTTTHVELTSTESDNAASMENETQQIQALGHVSNGCKRHKGQWQADMAE